MGKLDAQDDLWGSWALALTSLWYEVRADIPALNLLRPPRFLVGVPSRSFLAQWVPEHRVIEVSERLLCEFDWDNIEGVIRHEIAHQVVAELFGMRDAPAHGEAFRRACRLLGVPADASWQPMPAAMLPEPVLMRIRKLLAMSESENANEAAVALTKARELAARHDIDMLERFGTAAESISLRPLGSPWRRVPGWYWLVMAIVERCAFVRYVARSVPAGGHQLYLFEIYGPVEHLEMAEYIHDFLINRGEVFWCRWRGQAGRKVARMRDSYLKGLYSGVLERLPAEGEASDDPAAGLVPIEDPRVEALFQRRNPGVRQVSRTMTGRRDAMEKGLADSHSLHLQPGIRGGTGKIGLPG